MYYPILKNKMNEMKALENVQNNNFIPIIELVSANRLRYDEASKIFEKIKHNNTVMIDIPNYTKNEVIEKYDLLDPNNRLDFFQNFKNEYDNHIIPVLSFYYSSDVKKSIKNNITVLRGLLKEFDEIAIRILTDKTFKKNDLELLENIDVFMNDIFPRIYLIIEWSHNTDAEVKYVFDHFNVNEFKKTIITGEIHAPDKNSIKRIEELHCGFVKNNLLRNVETLKNKNQIFKKQIEYGDYTVVDKINPYEDEATEGPIVYVPFLRYTTKEGDICKYTAKEFGNMHQYRQLCVEITKHPDFDANHCSTCYDIFTIANGGDIAYKAGGTWKHRMITHHITSMAEYLDLKD